jgi:hypothetical protein
MTARVIRIKTPSVYGLAGRPSWEEPLHDARGVAFFCAARLRASHDVK